MTAQLKAKGQRINRKRVSRIMREQDLSVRPKPRFVATTDSSHDGPNFPDLAKGMAPTGPDQLWVADLTYIRILSGFVYLAVILDAWSRRVVGWAISRRIDAELALAALEAAIPVSFNVSRKDARLRARPPMIASSYTYDNAQAESVITTLKHEEVHLNGYETFQDAVARLPRFLEEVYNARRLHSAFGYLSPVRFEEIHTREAA